VGKFQKYYETLLERYPDSNPRGKAFERHSLEWLKTDPIWGPQVERIVPWNEWEHRSSVDIGTDLVMLLKNGDVWSVQCKATQPDKSLDLSDRLTTFLGHSMGPLFQGRLLITTSRSVGKNVDQMIKFQAKDLQTVFSHDLDESAVDLFELAFNNKIKIETPDAKRLRDYQLKAVRSIADELEVSDRTQISMACGTGKTFTSYSAWKTMGPNTTLVLVPSIHLLRQTLKEWIGFADNRPDFQWIAVCSDDSVSNDPEFPGEKLQNFSAPTTTSMDAIRRWISLPGKKVIFSTYQSSERVRDAFIASGQTLDLAICDEAHRLVGTIKEVSKYLAMVHPRPSFLKKSIFMTATPKVVNPSVVTRLERAGTGVITMNDEAIFGKRCFSFTFGEAIPKYLSPFRIAITIITDSEIREGVERRKFVKVEDSTVSLDEVAKHLALHKAVSQYGLTRVISYHSNLKSAEQFAKDVGQSKFVAQAGLKATLPIETEFVSGKQDSETRSRKLQLLKHGSKTAPKLVSNARCLTEGIDIPALDGVMFADPKYSEVDIVQAIGRAIRTFPGKSIGTVIVPIFADSEADFEKQLSESRWSTVWKTVRSLESHDPSLSAELAAIRTELGMGKAPRSLPSQFEILGIEKLSEDFSKALELRIVKESTNTWFEQLGKYIAKSQELKTGRVPQTLGRDSAKIPEGVWGAHQRVLFRQDQLDAEQISLLEAINGWSWEPGDDDWNFAIQRCREAGSKFLNYWNIPPGYEDELGFRVGQWLTSITSVTRWEKLPSERKKELAESIPGFVQSKRDTGWRLGYQTAKDWFKSDMSDPSVILIPGTGTKLSSWLQVATTLWQKRDSKNLKKIEMERISLLAQIPNWTNFGIGRRKHETLAKISSLKTKPNASGEYEFTFFRCGGQCSKHFGKSSSCKTEVTRISNQTMQLSERDFLKLLRYLEGLESYSKSIGSTYHPQRQEGEPFVWEIYPLGNSLNSFRSNDKHPEISKKVMALLDQLLDGKRVLPAIGDARLETIQHDYLFYSCNGDCETHFQVPGGICTTKSVSVQPEKLSVSKPSLASFLGYLEALADYSRVAGRCSHPQNQNRTSFRWNDFPLGSTLNRYRSGLSQSIRDEIGPILEQVPGWSWTSSDMDDWLNKFGYLKKYEQEFGTARVPQGTIFMGFNLGNWVHRQLNAGRGKRYAPLQLWQRNALLGLAEWTFDVWESREAYANRHQTWERNYEIYLKFLRQSPGTCLPDSKLEIDGLVVRRWVNSQIEKILGKSKLGVISPEEAAKLMSIDCFRAEIDRRKSKIDKELVE
jgi:superfamily II DNA or RNA helicase